MSKQVTVMVMSLINIFHHINDPWPNYATNLVFSDSKHMINNGIFNEVILRKPHHEWIDFWTNIRTRVFDDYRNVRCNLI